MTIRIIIDKEALERGEPAIYGLADNGVEYYGDEAVICDAQGVEVARVTGLAAGKEPSIGKARVWIETTNEVKFL